MQTIKKILKAIGNYISVALAWLLLSSKNPGGVSLSVKAALTAGVSWLTVLAGLGHIQLPSADLTTLIDAVVQITQTGLILIGLVASAFGIVRKIALTLQGNHAGLNSVLGN